MFGLIDGNNFYVSCERAFNPTLRGKPVIVLSNNDGCAIARSAEAKALGIKMGEVWHLSKRKPEFRNVIAKSSNYALYGDMSRRVPTIAEGSGGQYGYRLPLVRYRKSVCPALMDNSGHEAS